MKNTFFKIALLGFILGFFVLPSMGFAAGPINFLVTPAEPEPGTKIVFTLESFVVDVKGAYIQWKVDGKNVAEGTGMTSYQTFAGEFGSAMTVDAVIVLANGQTYKESLVLKPATVDILWQANTYVPPFFKGKALPVEGSIVHAVGLPNFSKPEALSKSGFTWDINEVRHIGKGTGVAAVDFEIPRGGGRLALSVKAENADRSSVAKKVLSFTANKPEVVFYEDSPLRGTQFTRALFGKVSSFETEFPLRVVPFYFSRPDRDHQKLRYAWYVNNMLVANADVSENITIINEGKSDEEKIVSLQITNSNHFTQTAGGKFSISFPN